MMRLRAVISLLAEDVAGLRLPPPVEEEGQTGFASSAIDELRRRERQALIVAGLAGLGLLVLLLAHQGPTPWLGLRGERAVFAVAALVVAALAGFRVGQWQRLHAVRRALEELTERSGEETTSS